MGWSNYLNLALEKLLGELLLLGVSLLWALLRLLSIISGKVEKGKRVHIKIFGRHLIEVDPENSSSDQKLIEKNI